MNEIMDCKIFPNYQNICRTCLSETEELVSVFTNSKFQSKTYAEMIMACTSLQILQTDEISLKICPICINEIEQSYLFYKKCQEAHFVLQFSHKFYITSQIESNSLKNNIIQSTYVDSVSGQTNQTINDEIKCDNYGEGLEDNGNDLTLSKFECGTLSTCILISIADQTNEVLNEEAKCDAFEESIAEQYNESNNDLSGSDFDRASLSPDILIPANDQTDELTNKDVHSVDFEVKVTDQSNKSNNGLSKSEFDCAPQVDISTRKQTDHKSENKITSSLNKNEENQMVQCKFCLKTYISELSLEKHMETHSNQHYKCDECSFKFSSSAILSRHKNVHRDSKEYVCNICNLNLPTLHHLKMHKVLHLNKPKNICDKCGRVFSFTKSFNIHKSSHDSSIKWKGEICGIKLNKSSMTRRVLLNSTSKSHSPVSSDILKCVNEKTNELTNKDISSKHSTEEIVDECNKSYGQILFSLLSKGKSQIDPSLENEPTSCLNESAENKIVQCKLCLKSWISQLSLEKHLKSHLKQTCECDECSLKFSTPARLRKHKKIHRIGKMYVCNICNLNFLGIRYLKMHRILHLNKPKFICDECGQILSSSVSLAMHKSIHDGTNKSYQCEVCGVKFDQKTLAKHRYVHKTTKRYICDKCGRGFILKADLMRHNMKCDGRPLCKREKLYKCSICSNAYTTKQRLTEHWRKKHQTELKNVNSGDELRRVRKPKFRQPKTICTDKQLNEREKLYKCSVCSKAFTSNQYLSYHCRSKHPELKQDTEYNCIHCKRTFNSKFFLDRHLPTHTFTLQTSCKICKKNFETYGKLQEHRKSEHIPNKKYQCQVCGKFLSTPTTLEKHMLVHTNPRPHKCSFCDKRFNHLAGKYSHERLHTGEKPFSCIQCNKSFRHQTTLVEHNRLHTGETPYKCFICNKGFYRTGNLKKHLITHK